MPIRKGEKDQKEITSSKRVFRRVPAETGQWRGKILPNGTGGKGFLS